MKKFKLNAVLWAAMHSVHLTTLIWNEMNENEKKEDKLNVFANDVVSYWPIPIERTEKNYSLKWPVVDKIIFKHFRC